MKERILIIDDDLRICSLLSDILESNGFEAEEAHTTEEAWGKLTQEIPDAVLLDIEIPMKGGLEFCREFKSKDNFKHVPVIFLTVRSQEVDKAIALNLGGDDFITKPFGHKELIARIKVSLRRSAMMRDKVLETTIRTGSLFVDFEKRLVLINDKDIHLSPKEFDILKLLYVNRHRVLSDRFIFDQVWGVQSDSMRSTVHTHINRLRKKLKAHGDKIKNVPGTGFRFDERKYDSR